ncbi:MAG: DUF4255 domain-containing protein [Anaerolineales bacterium]|nr:DUF4255 domain-containing protein [Anaerolineales bacterium]
MDHTTITATSATLQALFEGTITNAPEQGLAGLPIELRSPRAVRLDGDGLGLSVWLYRVEAASDRRTVMSAPGAAQRGDGLALELHYLLTPFAATPEDEQTVLARVLETLRDDPVLAGDQLFGGLTGEVRLSLEALTLEESLRLFTALQEPYRAAVALLARPRPLDA